LMQDRFLSLESAKLVFKSMGRMQEEITFQEGGLVQQRAQATLEKAIVMLEEICRIGLFAALEQGMFAEISRTSTGGRGLDGVFSKHPEYFNPFISLFASDRTGGGEPYVQG